MIKYLFLVNKGSGAFPTLFWAEVKCSNYISEPILALRTPAMNTMGVQHGQTHTLDYINPLPWQLMLQEVNISVPESSWTGPLTHAVDTNTLKSNLHLQNIHFSLPYGFYKVLWEADMQKKKKNLCPTWAVNQNHIKYLLSEFQSNSCPKKKKKYQPCSHSLLSFVGTMLWWCDVFYDKAAGYQTR